VLAQRAASEGPRWTRAVEDQSAPIPKEVTSELGGSMEMDDGRLMRAVETKPAASVNRAYVERMGT